jgi:hypothetical protein
MDNINKRNKSEPKIRILKGKEIGIQFRNHHFAFGNYRIYQFILYKFQILNF